MSAGETKEIELERADGAEPVKVEAVVKEIKEKVLPELDDELARSASEFDTLEELRADIEQRIRETGRSRGERGLPTRCARQAHRGVERPGFRAAGRSPHEDVAARARRRSPAQRWLARRVSADVRRFTRGSRRAPARPGGRLGCRRASCSRLPPTSSVSRSRTRRSTRPSATASKSRTRSSSRPARRGVRHGARKHAPCPRTRPHRRRGRADCARAGRCPRSHLDARQGKANNRHETVDRHLKTAEPAKPAVLWGRHRKRRLKEPA